MKLRIYYILFLMFGIYSSICAQDTSPSFTSEEELWIAEHPVLRVHNEKDWPPFNYYEYGKAKGLSIDYMNLLAKKIGIKVKYITGPTWNEFLDMLKNKQVDVMLNIVKTKERSEYILFTPPYVKNPNTIASLKSRSFSKLNELKGCSVAYPDGYFYDEIIRRNYPDITPVPLKDLVHCLKAVSAGEVDAALGKMAVLEYIIRLNMLTNVKVNGQVDIGDLDRQLLRIGVRKEDKILNSILVKAMKSIKFKEMSALLERWITTQGKSESNILPKLTGAEKKWLENHKKIRLGVDKHFPPFEFVVNGETNGIGFEIIKLIEKKLPIEFQITYNDDWSETLKGVENGEIDAISLISPTNERKQFLNFTKPYVNFRRVFITRKDHSSIKGLKDLEGEVVAVTKGYATSEFIKKNYPNMKQLVVDSSLDKLLAVATGKADFTIEGLTVATYLIENNSILNLKVAGRTTLNSEALGIGVRKDWEPLIPILNKTINTISYSDKRNIYNKLIGYDQFSNPIKIHLSEVEEKWLDKHPVIKFCGRKSCLPREGFTEDGAHVGIIADYLNIFENMIGVRIERVPVQTNLDAVNKLKSSKVDMISNTTFRDGAFIKNFIQSKKCFESKVVFITSVDKSNIVTSDDLNDKRVVFVKNKIYGVYILKQHPGIIPIYVNTVEEGLKKVSEGKADAICLQNATANYYIRNLNIKDLKINLTSSLSKKSNFIFNKDQEVLKSIIDKCITALSTRDVEAIGKKWVARQASQQPTKVKEDQEILYLLTLTIVLMILLFSATWAVVRFYGEFIPKQVQDIGGKLVGIIAMSIFLGTVVLGGIIGLRGIEQRSRNHAKEVLRIILDGTINRATTWIKGQETIIRTVASDSQFIDAAYKVVEISQLNNLSLESYTKPLRRKFLSQHPLLSSEGFEIIAPNHSVAYSFALNKKQLSSIVELEDRSFLEKAFEGYTVFVPPTSSKKRSSDKKSSLFSDLSIFLLTPIKGSDGEIFAVLSFKYNPEDEFSNIFSSVKFSHSGEAYAFNSEGYMLSNSRLLNNWLKKNSEETFKILKPSKDNKYHNTINAEFTLPVKMSLQEKDNNIHDSWYMDYRGVKSYGQWFWSKKCNMGFVCKVDEANMLQGFYSDRKIIVSVISVTLLLALMLIAYSIWASYKAKIQLQKAKDDWERIAEHKTKELVKAELQSRMILESVGDGIIGINTEGLVTFLNPAAERMLGFSSDDLLGADLHEKIHQPSTINDTTKIELCPIWESYTKGVTKVIDNETFWRKDGSSFPIHCVSTPILENEKVMGAVISFNDMTERMKMQNALKQAKDAADRANKAKTDFLANMSHEIRTPMNAVLGFSELLINKVKDQSILKYLKLIYNSSQALLTLINDILDLSSIEAGKFNLQYDAVNIKELMNEVKLIFQQKVLDKKLDFKVECSSNVPDLLIIDSLRVKQVLINLIGNAVKFTERGFISLQLNAGDILPGTSKVDLKLIVQDSGIGIPKEDVDKIFVAFEQTTGQKKIEFGGTGLGLSITKKIINMMGGSISLESNRGEGAKFIIEIPNVEIGAEEENKTQDNIYIEAVKFAKSKILVCDDIDYNRELILKNLDQWDFEIFEASNGQEAIDLANEVVPDLILMDMKMPVVDGYEATKIIKQNPKLAKIPILAVTASVLKKDISNITTICDGFIAKPISLFRLVKELMQYLDHEISSDEKDESATSSGISVEDLSVHLLELPPYILSDLRDVLNDDFNIEEKALSNLMVELELYSEEVADELRNSIKNNDFSKFEEVLEINDK